MKNPKPFSIRTGRLNIEWNSALIRLEKPADRPRLVKSLAAAKDATYEAENKKTAAVSNWRESANRRKAFPWLYAMAIIHRRTMGAKP